MKSLKRLRLRPQMMSPVPREGIGTQFKQMAVRDKAGVPNSALRRETHEPFLREENWRSSPTTIAECSSDVDGGDGCDYAVQWATGYTWPMDIFHHHETEAGEIIIVRWKRP